MKICISSKEYIKWIKNKHPIDVEPYVPLSVVPDPIDEYVPEYIIPSMPGVEPYVPKDIMIDVEEWKSRAKEWEEYQKAKAILASKKHRIWWFRFPFEFKTIMSNNFKFYMQ